MFYLIFFLISILLNLAFAFAMGSVGLFGMGLIFVAGAAISLGGMLLAAHIYQ